ncbi:MAG: PP0621 family protein [Gammaproteobacteria bacterium]
MPGLVRLIVLGLVIGFVYKLIRKFQQNRLQKNSESSSRSKNNVSSKKTVQCDHCGVYVPANELVSDGEKNFCSQEHKEAFDL